MVKTNSNNKKGNSFKGKYYYAWIKTYELTLHSRNIRDYEPLDDLIDSMREFGFIKSKPIIVVYENGKPAIVNGNQRWKAAKIVPDIIEMYCMIFHDIDVAVEFATIDNKQIKWTPYQKYENAYKYYKNQIHKGFSKLQAFNKTKKKLTIKDRHLLHDYLSISKLPDIVKALVKKPKNRKNEEKAIIGRIDFNNKLKAHRTKLSIEKAGYMGKHLVGIGIDDNIMCEIGIEIILEKEFKDAKIIIEAIAKNYLDQTPLETIRFYKTKSHHKQINFSKNYELKKYNEIVERFAYFDMNAKSFISGLIDEELKFAKECVSNKDNYIVNVKGRVRAGFSFDQVRNKSWDNTKLPQLIKDFLNEIKFTDDGIYLKYDKYEIGIFNIKTKKIKAMKYTKMCPYCNEEFETDISYKKFCCDEHQRIYNFGISITEGFIGKTLKCKECRESFTQNRANQKYCKNECRKDYHYRQQFGKDRPKL